MAPVCWPRAGAVGCGLGEVQGVAGSRSKVRTGGAGSSLNLVERKVNQGRRMEVGEGSPGSRHHQQRRAP